jgi:hypothetical protein
MTAMTTFHIVCPRPAVAGCIFCTIVRDTRTVPREMASLNRAAMRVRIVASRLRHKAPHGGHVPKVSCGNTQQ